MKILSIGLILIVCAPMTAFSKLAVLPLEERIQNSDLIVIGTLVGVSEKEIDFVTHGTGRIVIQRIVGGNVTTSRGEEIQLGDELELKYIEGFACVMGSHRRIENEKGIFLITIGEDNEIKYADFASLESLSEINRLLENGIKPAGIARVVKTRNDVLQTFFDSDKIESVSAMYDTNQSPVGEYSPGRAFLTIVISCLLFVLCYHKRLNLKSRFTHLWQI